MSKQLFVLLGGLLSESQNPPIVWLARRPAMGNVKSNLNQGFELNQEVVDSSARLAGKLSKGCRVRVVGFEQEAIVTGFDSAHVWAAIDGHIGKYIKTTVYMPGEEPPKPRLLVSAASSASSGSLGMPGSIQAQPQSREVIPASDPAIQKVFGKYDKDGSGQMEAKELRSCLRQLNVLVDDAEGDEVRRRPAARRSRVCPTRASCCSPQPR